MLDKVCQKLNGRNAHLLSLVGKVTLAKLVLLLIPNYFLQTTKVIKGKREEIEKVIRRFIWGSLEDNLKASCGMEYIMSIYYKYGFRTKEIKILEWFTLAKVWIQACK